ncbi:hypothetical protein glysoja_028820 [Glycine soja]|uniref:RNase H type-1 domain-containing protein n=1 Tax=Glycine soja TaxID=3848 RepID=A0A0B2NVS5_GLYSO|nr:hypothetical protein glysoja_028820 [Glycine soja]
MVGCSKAQQCWLELDMRHLIELLFHEVEGFAELVFRLFETLREDKLKECCMVFWSLWHARNERLWEELDVHEGEALDLMEAIRWLRSMNMDIVIFEVDSQRVYNGMKRRLIEITLALNIFIILQIVLWL